MKTSPMVSGISDERWAKAKQLLADPEMTVSALAQRLGVTYSAVRKRLQADQSPQTVRSAAPAMECVATKLASSEKRKLEALAKRSGVTLTKYLRAWLVQHIEEKTKGAMAENGGSR